MRTRSLSSAEPPVLKEIVEEAKQTTDPEICNKIVTYPCWFNECIYRIAEKTKNIELCEKIKRGEEGSINYYETCYYTISSELLPEH